MLATCLLRLSLELVTVKILQPGFPQHKDFSSSDPFRSDLVPLFIFFPVFDLCFSPKAETGIQPNIH